MNLTPHFTVEELTRSSTALRLGLDNTPDPSDVENLKRLAALLEGVRAICGNRILRVSSGLRKPKVNKAVGSSDRSQHVQGCAADFTVDGLTPRQVMSLILTNELPFDQVILEFDRWVHISIPIDPNGKSREMALIVDANGTRGYA